MATDYQKIKNTDPPMLSQISQIGNLNKIFLERHKKNKNKPITNKSGIQIKPDSKLYPLQIQKVMKSFDKNKIRFQKQELNLQEQLHKSIKRVKLTKSGANLLRFICKNSENSNQTQISQNQTEVQRQLQIHFKVLQQNWKQSMKIFIRNKLKNQRMAEQILKTGIDFKPKYQNLGDYFLCKKQICNAYINTMISKKQNPLNEIRIKQINCSLNCKKADKPNGQHKSRLTQIQQEIAESLKRNIQLSNQYLAKVHKKLMSTQFQRYESLLQSNIERKMMKTEIIKYKPPKKKSNKTIEHDLYSPSKYLSRQNFYKGKSRINCNAFFEKDFKSSLTRQISNDTLPILSRIGQISFKENPQIMKSVSSFYPIEDFRQAQSIIELINECQKQQNHKLCTDTRKRILQAYQNVFAKHQSHFHKKVSIENKIHTQYTNCKMFAKVNGTNYKF